MLGLLSSQTTIIVFNKLFGTGRISSSIMNMAASSSTTSSSRDGSHGTCEETNQRPDVFLADPTASQLSRCKELLLQSAVSLKDQVVQATWRPAREERSVDPTVYTGLLGTAFACLRCFQLTGSHADLLLCAEIVDACTVATRSVRHMTFLCGRGGVYALGAVIYDYMGDQTGRNRYIDMFLEVAREKALPAGPEEGGFGMSYDLLYGRAGFLWAALFIRKHLGEQMIPDELLTPVVEAIFAGGRAGASDKPDCPLMYRWHGTRYWGAAHGLAGILHVLLHFPLSEPDAQDIKGALRYMIDNRFPHSGNYPSYEGNLKDNLVQWSHGATSMAITLSKASQVFPGDRGFRDAAIEAGEVVWKSGLSKKVGLADGVAGNAYAFLSLYRLTGEAIYEERAKAFGSFLYHNTRELVGNMDHLNASDDHLHSLYLGLAGTCCLWFDLFCPEKSRFPGYEL